MSWKTSNDIYFDVLFIYLFEYKTRFYLIRRKDEKVVKTKYIGEPFVFFHTINAFEDNNQVVIDICCYPDNKVITSFSEKKLKGVHENHEKLDTFSEVRRFVLPLMEYFTNVYKIWRLMFFWKDTLQKFVVIQMAFHIYGTKNYTEI